MSDLIKEIEIDGINHPIGADAKNISVDENTNLIEALNDKVAKDGNKTLSTNDYTTTDKQKLDGIAAGAEVNVQSDWSETNKQSDAYIKNKPTIPSVGDGTVTIIQGGQKRGSFSMNQSGNTTINLEAGGSGSGEVAATDAVIENSLTVNGYVVEGNGHNPPLLLSWLDLPDSVSESIIQVLGDDTQYSDVNFVFDGVTYKYKTIFTQGRSSIMEALPDEFNSYRYYKGNLAIQQLGEKPLCILDLQYVGDNSVTIYHNFNIDGYGGALYGVFITNYYNEASNDNIHIQGRYSDLENIDILNYAHIVGGGTSDTTKINIHTLDWQGNATFVGDIIFGGTSNWLALPSKLQFLVYEYSMNWKTISPIKIHDQIYNYQAIFEMNSNWLLLTPGYYYLCDLLYDGQITGKQVVVQRTNEQLYVYATEDSAVQYVSNVQSSYYMPNISGSISLAATIQDLYSKIAALEAAQS